MAVSAVVQQFNDANSGEIFIRVSDYVRDMAPNMRRAEAQALMDTDFYECDIVVGILWSRLGTPTGAIDPDTGEEYPSGTAEELAEARRRLQGSSLQGKKLLRAMVYVCTRTPGWQVRILHRAQYRRAQEYRGLLKQRHEAITEFNTMDEFCRLLRGDLDKVLGQKQRSTRSGPAFGESVWLRCDRRSPVTRFKGALSAQSTEREAPRVYLMCGVESDRPGSLAQRLGGEVRENFHRVFRPPRITLALPGDDPEDDPCLTPEELGRSWAQHVLGKMDSGLARDTCEVRTLLRSSTFKDHAGGVVVLDHLLRLRRNDQWNAVLRDALKWYVIEFWGAYRTEQVHLSHATAVVLVTVVCPNSVDSDLGVAVNTHDEQAVGAVRADLRSIQQAPCNCRPQLLPALIPVDRQHVLEWFEEHQIYETETEWGNAIEKHFERPESFDKRPMGPVEDALMKIHKEFIATRFPQAS